ncbi:hypothetical protein CC1G_07536 [Coprinopsis cinerea okayama7|uniref:BZIP domain-containing protein n=1 Tax=Coprinopsis cinerea (strain Okayama-7 / 130 / ATCC MYA-4618 / FGSC 9003) TaxID=240176 RepID=A8P185_COPC7|nr:hypothetical protein CC1G_07536 [Coprinopsis cinerea okayama7\|eukprot:XP_001838046.2 hypothetical protein CC1G_07536 [Coprinopsis cinerea okayama7\
MTTMSSTSSTTANPVDKPERSRNARAQARHRAKRKAYIEQLEQTVTKLQAALGFSPEQVSALPPSSITIRELQQDNSRLQKEIEELRRALAEMSGARRGSIAPYPDPRCDRDYKRRKMSSHLDSVYMGPSDSHLNDRPPPPLTIPHYGSVSSSSNSNGSLFNMHGSTFQMPNTPSGSSATSSPPFSPIQMQAHPSLDQRPPLPHSGSMSNYSHSQYSGSVKVEDDSYGNSNNHHSSISYSYSNQQHNNGLDWHSYSSERAQLHR